MNIRERAAMHNHKMTFMDGFDDAIVGVVQRGDNGATACYDTDKCVEILMDRDKMSREEAREFFEYNILRAYHGPYTPYFLETL